MINYKAVKQIYSDMSAIVNDDTSERKIFHYTNTDVLNIILSNATLRASHVFYLNDAEEYYKGIDIISRAIGKDLCSNNFNESQGIFSISFSEGEDLLSQWITYAKESGVSIEFDNRLLSLSEEEGKPRFIFGIEDDVKNDDKDKSFTHLVFDTSKVLHRIRYVSDIEKVKSQIKNSYEKTCETDMSGMPLYATYMKHNSFEAEKEIRAAFIYHELIESLDEKADRFHPKLNYYRMEKGILRPYINVRLLYLTKTDRNDSGEYTPMLPLKSITVGPSGSQQSVFDSIVHRIKYGETKVYDYSNDTERFNKNFESYLNDVCNWITENRELHASVDEISSKLPSIKSKLVSQWKANNLEQCHLIDDRYSVDLTDMPKEIIHIIQEVNKSFYFSPKGILIKKSKIPYIF